MYRQQGCGLGGDLDGAVGTLAALAHDDVAVPVDVAVSRDTLVVVMTLLAIGAGTTTDAVGGPGGRLLTDESLTALRVDLTGETGVNACHAHSSL